MPVRLGRLTASCLLAASAWMVAGLPARATTGTQYIDFDQLTAGSVITDQYAGQYGVLMNGAVADDTGNEVWAARSAPIAIVLATTSEFECRPTLAIHFRRAVGRVKLWFGLRIPVPGDGSVVLKVYDDQGQTIGQTEVPVHGGDGPESVDRSLELGGTGPIARAEISVIGGVGPCMIGFDDLEFDQYTPPADLALGPPRTSYSVSALVVDVDIRNVGGRASGATTLSAQAGDWPPATTTVEPVDPGATTVGEVSLSLPAEAAGRTVELVVALDPKGAGDVNADNNEIRQTITLGPPPTAEETTTDTPAAPTSEAAVPLPTEIPLEPADQPTADVAPLAVVVGLVAAAAGGGFVLRRRRWTIGAKPDEITITGNVGTESVTVTINKQQLELKAEDPDPPERCQAGQWYCQRAVTFDPRQRALSALTVKPQAPGGQDAALSAAIVEPAARVLREIRDSGSADELGLLRLADQLADRAIATANGPAFDLIASVRGSSAQAKFTAYRCNADENAVTGAFKDVANRTVPVEDKFERILAHSTGASARQRTILRSQLVASLSALAAEL